MGMFRGTGRLRGNVRLTASVANGNGNGNGNGDELIVPFDGQMALTSDGFFSATYAISEGSVYGWGNLSDDSIMQSSPMLILSTQNFSFVNAPTSKLRALTSSGQRWERDRFDQNPTLEQVDEEFLWKNVAQESGNGIAMGVQTNGTLWVIDTGGGDINGILGISGGYFDFGPVQVEEENDWKEVVLNINNSFVLKSDGRLFAAGTNYGGYGGIHVQIGNDSDWKKLVTSQRQFSGSHQIALKNNGTLWTWGGNDNGQLGNGNTDEVETPTQIQIDQSWKSVAASNDSSFAVRADGTLWSWGGNLIEEIIDSPNPNIKIYGLLGHGDTNSPNVNTPTQIGSLTDWAAVFAGDYHVMAVREDGSVYAWGLNKNGRLGLGDTNIRTEPTLIADFNLLSA
jgi:hypothetical protein